MPQTRNIGFGWNAVEYLGKVEWISLKWFQWFQSVELAYLQTLPELSARTIIDAGAGYGRDLAGLATRARNFVAVELDANMYSALEKHAKAFYNVTPIKGDYTKLEQILEGIKGQIPIEKPAIISLQNSLGTTIGNIWNAVSEFRKVAQKHSGDVISSVYNAENMPKFGFQLYKQLEDMVGPMDEGKTDLKAGLYATKTGFSSQWFTPEMRERLKRDLGGQLMAEVKAGPFTLIHVTYAGGLQP